VNEIIRTIIIMVLSIVLPLAAQLADKRRMPASKRGRCWNYATWGGSVYAFGALSMLGWMWVTRPRGWRLLWGWLSCIGVQLATLSIDAGVQLALAGNVSPKAAEATLVITVFGMIITLVMELVVTLLTLVGIGRWAR